MNKITVESWTSPFGDMIIGSYSDKLCLCDWSISRHRTLTDNRIKKILNTEYEYGENIVIKNTIQQLEEYFVSERKKFTIPLLLLGSEFQVKVWNELTKIPYGQTISYKELSIMIGNPKSVRAVALANSHNPISIIVPCHRVIGHNGSLTGYASGLEIKKRLLDIEKEE